MPTEAVTGTQSLHTTNPAAAEKPDEKPAAKADDPKPATKTPAKAPARKTRKAVKAPAKAKADDKAPAVEALPLADPSGNGSIQVTKADGSTTNIDGGQDGWQDKVRDLDPKHGSLRAEGETKSK
jgi:hypothetical protein